MIRAGPGPSITVQGMGKGRKEDPDREEEQEDEGRCLLHIKQAKGEKGEGRHFSIPYALIHVTDTFLPTPSCM